IDILNQYPRVHELPFDSERKLMTTVHEVDGQYISITKGAPDVLLARVTDLDIDGKKTPVTKKHIDDFTLQNQTFADQALRVLAIAYKVYEKSSDVLELSYDDLENNLTMLGLVGMIDPARPEVKDAI